MPNPFSGGCACGAIRYTCSAEPILVANCHCRDCQRSSGSAFATNAVVPIEAVSLTAAAPTYYDTQADRGHRMSRGFCGRCGSPVLLKNSAYPNVLVIHAGSLDDPRCVQPTMDIYTASAQPWDHMNPALSKFAAMPPPAAVRRPE